MPVTRRRGRRLEHVFTRSQPSSPRARHASHAPRGQRLERVFTLSQPSSPRACHASQTPPRTAP